MKEVSEAARRKEATLSFVFVFPYKNGIFIVKQTTCHECKTWYWRTMMLNLAHILVVIHKMSWMRCHRQIVIDGMSWKGFK
ncbi:hypothetical protein YC2023_076882 [Brassica napus]